MNTAKGVIFCRAMEGVTNEEVRDGLASQGVIRAERIVRRRCSEISTHSFFLTFDTPSVPEKLKVGDIRQRIPVRRYVPNPMRCFRCQRFGRTSSRCTRTEVCGRCSADQHTAAECTSETLRCVNCESTGHASSARDCPEWLNEKEILSLSDPPLNDTSSANVSQKLSQTAVQPRGRGGVRGGRGVSTTAARGSRGGFVPFRGGSSSVRGFPAARGAIGFHRAGGAMRPARGGGPPQQQSGCGPFSGARGRGFRCPTSAVGGPRGAGFDGRFPHRGGHDMSGMTGGRGRGFPRPLNNVRGTSVRHPMSRSESAPLGHRPMPSHDSFTVPFPVPSSGRGFRQDCGVRFPSVNNHGGGRFDGMTDLMMRAPPVSTSATNFAQQQQQFNLSQSAPVVSNQLTSPDQWARAEQRGQQLLMGLAAVGRDSTAVWSTPASATVAALNKPPVIPQKDNSVLSVWSSPPPALKSEGAPSQSGMIYRSVSNNVDYTSPLTRTFNNSNNSTVSNYSAVATPPMAPARQISEVDSRVAKPDKVSDFCQEFIQNNHKSLYEGSGAPRYPRVDRSRSPRRHASSQRSNGDVYRRRGGDETRERRTSSREEYSRRPPHGHLLHADSDSRRRSSSRQSADADVDSKSVHQPPRPASRHIYEDRTPAVADPPKPPLDDTEDMRQYRLEYEQREQQRRRQKEATLKVKELRRQLRVAEVEAGINDAPSAAAPSGRGDVLFEPRAGQAVLLSSDERPPAPAAGAARQQLPQPHRPAATAAVGQTASFTTRKKVFRIRKDARGQPIQKFELDPDTNEVIREVPLVGAPLTSPGMPMARRVVLPSVKPT